MFDHPLLRRFGPFSRFGSLVNVVIVSAIALVNVLASQSEFERKGKLVWGVILVIAFVVVAIIVWVRWARQRSRPDGGSADDRN